MMKRLALVVLAMLGCVTDRPLRPSVTTYSRPGAVVGPGRVALKFSARTAITKIDPNSDARMIASMGRAGRAAIGRDSGPDQGPALPVEIIDGAEILPDLESKLEVALARHGYVVVREPPFDLELEVSLATVRYDRDAGWLADEASVRIRNPENGELLRSVDVAEDGGAARPSVLLMWAAEAALGKSTAKGAR